MRFLLRFALALLFLAALPLAAQTGTWTAVASTGDIDESSNATFSVNGPNLSHAPAATGTVTVRYNVTNTYGGGFDDTPPWSTFELGYFDNSTLSSIRATLYRVDPCTGNQIILCSFTTNDSAVSTCQTCPITAGFDFSQYLYYVELLVNRSTTAVTPIAKTLRIY